MSVRNYPSDIGTVVPVVIFRCSRDRSDHRDACLAERPSTVSTNWRSSLPHHSVVASTFIRIQPALLSRVPLTLDGEAGRQSPLPPPRRPRASHSPSERRRPQTRLEDWFPKSGEDG